MELTRKQFVKRIRPRAPPLKAPPSAEAIALRLDEPTEVPNATALPRDAREALEFEEALE